MKFESLDLHGLNVDEALLKTRQNLSWCFQHQVAVIDINHGKGRHSQLGFSVLKQEIRRYLREESMLKEYGYRIVPGESDLPIALSFDDGHTLVVLRGYETDYLGGRSQQEKNKQVFSAEGRQQRKAEKNLRKDKKKRS